MRKKLISAFVCPLMMIFMIAGCANSASNNNLLQPDKPVTITVWTYYNGPQLTAFTNLIDEFNRTEGKAQGIVVESSNRGSVEELQEKVLESVRGKVGADPVPNIFAAYADTAFVVDNMGLLADMSAYFTDEEKDLYVDAYLNEGAFGDGEIKIFPVAKSTELLLLNKSDWEPFAQALGFTYADLATMDGLLRVAEAYYEWSDGKAFFGRDAMANYMLIGAMQLNCEIVSVDSGKAKINFKRDVVRKLWDYYYVPYVKGYFAASGRFRSDDVKTGNILAYVGSSPGAMYFPTEITTNDDDTHPIEMEALPTPQFNKGKPVAVQQGAGMVVTNASEAEVYASVVFLKWFTEAERNIRFSIGSGYLPVMKSANSIEAIEESADEIDETMRQILNAAVDTVNDMTLYTPKAFDNGTRAREILEYAMSDRASADRLSVLQKIEAGAPEEDALQEFLSDAYFDAWYEATNASLQELVH